MSLAHLLCGNPFVKSGPRKHGSPERSRVRNEPIQPMCSARFPRSPDIDCGEGEGAGEKSQDERG